jgi:hypothetical protein
MMTMSRRTFLAWVGTALAVAPELVATPDVVVLGPVAPIAPLAAASVYRPTDPLWEWWEGARWIPLFVLTETDTIVKHPEHVARLRAGAIPEVIPLRATGNFLAYSAERGAYAHPLRISGMAV